MREPDTQAEYSRVVATVKAPANDFWSHAPELYELAASLSERLTQSASGPGIANEIRSLAALIPRTPEPLGDLDPYLRSALLTAVIHAMAAQADGDDRELRIAVERIRQALRDALDEHPVWRAGPKDAAIWLRGQGIPLSDLAEILQASESSVRRWANPDDETHPSGENADRVVVIAKVVNHLRHAMSVRGTVQWLTRPHPVLDDRRPMDELKDPDAYRRVIHLASGARSMVAT